VFVLQTLGGFLGHIWLNSTIYIHEMQCNRNENDDRGRERERERKVLFATDYTSTITTTTTTAGSERRRSYLQSDKRQLGTQPTSPCQTYLLCDRSYGYMSSRCVPCSNVTPCTSNLQRLASPATTSLI
jgi:hypothetical protein